jgi:site-specific DNA-methyltransferase (adenine-specific)
MNITNEDNMELMARYEDNYFDLAIVDPPYGISVNMNAGRRKGEKKRYTEKNWDDSIPKPEYFKELQRVSKNQIVWGCNYFDGLLWSHGRISWFKNVGAENDYSDCELAMSSFDNKVTYVKVDWSGFIMPASERGTKRIHPTQKPIQLYEWLLQKYAKEGDKILDTHLGSGSIAIACHNRKFDLTACELDKEYYDKAMKRLKEHMAQQRLF